MKVLFCIPGERARVGRARRSWQSRRNGRARAHGSVRAPRSGWPALRRGCQRTRPSNGRGRRTSPPVGIAGLPLKCGRCGTITHDYKRTRRCPCEGTPKQGCQPGAPQAGARGHLRRGVPCLGGLAWRAHAADSSRVVMLIRLIFDPAAELRRTTNQMRQQLIPPQHFRRGNASSHFIWMACKRCCRTELQSKTHRHAMPVRFRVSTIDALWWARRRMMSMT